MDVSAGDADAGVMRDLGPVPAGRSAAVDAAAIRQLAHGARDLCHGVPEERRSTARWAASAAGGPVDYA